MRVMPRLSEAAAVVIVAAAGVLGLPNAGGAAGPATWYVDAATGADSTSCGASATAACKTISQAVTNAAAGDTIRVAVGTYAEQVTVGKMLDVEGPGIGGDAPSRATVSPPASANNGFLLGPGSAGSTVAGFWVTGAQGEGILAMQTSNVTIADNVVQNNDQGAHNPNTTYDECKAQGEIPGDCGEGIHLMSVTGSHVVFNNASYNAGGILLTDEMGPTAHNVVGHNVAFDNADDCGITVVGHNPNAAPNGKPAPAAGGVYANDIIGNTSNDNGLVGQGAGIILAGAGPGTAVYDNLVRYNNAHDNGLAGVTLHDHAPGQYMNGNAIIGNSFDHNALTGGANGTPGDQDTGPSGLTQTADVDIVSAVDLVKFTVIARNSFSNAHFGIWTHNAPSIVYGNVFASSVTVPIAQSPAPVRTTIKGPSVVALYHAVALSGAAQASVPVSVQYWLRGSGWRVAKVVTSTTGGAWSASVPLRWSSEAFRAVAYGSTSSVLTVRAS